MKPSSKIKIIVSVQILLLVCTFFIIQSQESTMTELGHQINVSGKIRALSYASLNSATQSHYSQTTYNSSNLEELETFVMAIENGGDIFGHKFPLPQPLQKSLILDLRKNFDIFNTNMVQLKKFPDTYNETQLYLSTYNLVTSADVLTKSLADYNTQMSKELIELSLLLIILNILLSVGLAVLIIKILKREHEEKTKTEKMKIIGELAARLSHDIRNPLSVVNMATDVLQKMNIQNNKERDFTYFKKIQEKLDMIQRSAILMNHQVNDVLNFARTTDLQLTNESIQSILKSSLQKLIIPERVKIFFPQNDVKISCDSKKLEVVFTNLIQNSIEAIEGSGKIIIRIYEFEKNIVIDIEDSGKGFSKESKSNLFVPLFTTKPLGTGLGLITCKNIIEQHQGTLSIRTNPTVFSISLPVNLSK